MKHLPSLHLPRFSRTAFNAWLHQHRQALQTAIGHILASPLGTLLTVLAIAIALALPNALFLTIDTLGTALGNQNARQISAFMKLSVDGRELHTIAAELEKDPLIERVEVIGRQESLQRFRDSSGMEDLLDLLPTNPLPAVLIIHPRETVDEMDSLERLAMKIEARTTVEQVVLDREWMGTLFSTVAAFKRFSLLMTLLFALLVGLVIHNGLRIDVLEHRHEIEVIKLVGGSDHYIQRPFHYHAVIVGAAGGLLAALFIALLFAILQPRFDELGAAYGVELPLRVGAGFALTLVLLATILSLLSSRITLGALLKRIQP